jgi:ABC-type polysaccharide/polyol phosphate export permease
LTADNRRVFEKERGLSAKTRSTRARNAPGIGTKTTPKPTRAERRRGEVPRALAGLWEKRWLAVYFVRGELSHSYRDSFLGLLWLVLNPLLMISLYTLVFSEILGLRFNRGGGPINFGLYLYCGLLPFSIFSDTVSQSVTTVKKNAGLIQKVVFPLEILPISTAVTNLVTKLVGVSTLVVVFALLYGAVQPTLLLLPLVLIPQMAFTLGLGLMAAVFGAYVPDVKETLRTFLRALFFVTPIIWPPSIVPEKFRFVVDYNPLAHLVEVYRDLILRGELPGLTASLWFSLLAAVVLAAGLWLYVRAKDRFADLA